MWPPESGSLLLTCSFPLLSNYIFNAPPALLQHILPFQPGASPHHALSHRFSVWSSSCLLCTASHTSFPLLRTITSSKNGLKVTSLLEIFPSKPIHTCVLSLVYSESHRHVLFHFVLHHLCAQSCKPVELERWEWGQTMQVPAGFTPIVLQMRFRLAKWYVQDHTGFEATSPRPLFISPHYTTF